MTHARRRRGTTPPPSSPLPPLYAAWVTEALGTLPADEQTATCQSCVMLPPVGDGTGSGTTSSLFFDPRSKCCTYIPELPNYVVGRVLLDASPDAAEGRASVVARVVAGSQVTPLGLDKPPAFAILYGNNSAELFGRAVDLRCPHYLADTGGCGIWRHRMSTCGTWFCKHDRGDVGRGAWFSVRQLLRTVERAVAVHCVRTLAPGSRALQQAQAESNLHEPRVRPSDLVAPLDAPTQQALWGTWAGRELAFFEACGSLAGQLTWADIAALGGVELALAVDVARDAVTAATSAAIPKAVRLGLVTVASADADDVACTTYSQFDPLSIPRPLFELLHLFDGRPTSKALAAISAAGLELDKRVVRRLLDHRVLVDATQPGI